MIRLKHIFLCFLLLNLFCLAFSSFGEDDDSDDFPEDFSSDPQQDFESAVITITSEDFQPLLGQHEALLIEFYAPWCGFCQNFAPVYEEVATQLADKVVVGKVNAIEEIALAEEFDIQAYPSLFLVKNHEVVQYEGDFSFQEVVNWVLRRLGPQISELKTVEEAAMFLQNPPLLLAAVTKDSEGHKVLHSLDISLFNDLEVGEIEDPKVQESLSLQPNELRLITHDSEEPISASFETLSTASEVSRWLIWNKFPLLSALSHELFDQLIQTDVIFAIVFIPDSLTNVWLKTAMSISEGLKDSVKVTWASSDQLNRFLLQLGGTGNFLPTIIAFPVDKNKKALAWNEDEELTVESAVTWLKGVADGTSVGFRKSEAVPVENPGPVIQVVGKTFDSIVLDSTKDVLLEVYANWCGHCKQLEPLYDELAKLLKPVQSLVVARIDGDANSLPDDIVYESFPTIFLLPADSKVPILFQGERKITSFVEFIKENSKNNIPIEIPESIRLQEQEDGDDEVGHIEGDEAPEIFKDIQFQALRDEL